MFHQFFKSPPCPGRSKVPKGVLIGFHPSMVYLPNLDVKRRDRSRGAPPAAIAQSLERLDLGQKTSFLNWRRHPVPIINKTISGWYRLQLTKSYVGVTAVSTSLYVYAV
jgi:hypothetical protein